MAWLVAIASYVWLTKNLITHDDWFGPLIAALMLTSGAYYGYDIGGADPDLLGGRY